MNATWPEPARLGLTLLLVTMVIRTNRKPLSNLVRDLFPLPSRGRFWIANAEIFTILVPIGSLMFSWSRLQPGAAAEIFTFGRHMFFAIAGLAVTVFFQSVILGHKIPAGPPPPPWPKPAAEPGA